MREALRRVDDGRMPIAEISRRLGQVAEGLGLLRPSYECVRVAVHEERRWRAYPSTLQVLTEISTRARPPDALLDHLSGIGVRPLP